MEFFASLGPVLQTVGMIAGFLVLLSFMVFFHELGHFTMAKLAGVRVEEFGIGFPPRVWARRRGETEYSINALPLGGFCKMTGENGDGEAYDPKAFTNAPKRWRFAILVGGPAMNMLLAVAIFTVAYMAGWPAVTRSEIVVQAVVAGLPADAAGVKTDDVILTLGDEPTANVVDLRRIAEVNRGKDVPLTVRRSGSNVDLRIKPRADWPAGEGPLGVSIGDKPTKIEPVSYPVARRLPAAHRRLGR